MTTCRECGANVSSAAATCPHCGIECPSAAVKQSQATAKLIRNMLVIVIVGGGVYSCATMFNRTSDAPATPSTETVARATCRQAVRQMAKNPSSAEVPYAKDIGNGQMHRFAWRRGEGLTMMNAFGAKLDTFASCTTSADGTRVTGLVINGTSVL